MGDFGLPTVTPRESWETFVGWLYAEYEDRLRRGSWTRAIVGQDQSLLEDAVQDAFLSLLKNAERGKIDTLVTLRDAPRGVQYRILVTIVRRKAIDLVRSRARKGGEGRHLSTDEILEAPPAVTPDASGAVAEGALDILREELAKIGPRKREAFERFYFQGQTSIEIAEIMGYHPPSSARRRIKEVRDLLEDHLAKRLHPEKYQKFRLALQAGEKQLRKHYGLDGLFLSLLGRDH